MTTVNGAGPLPGHFHLGPSTSTLAGRSWALPDTLFLDWLGRARPARTHGDRFAAGDSTGLDDLGEAGRVVCEDRSRLARKVLLDLGSAMALVAVQDGFAEVMIGGEPAAVEAAAADLRRRLAAALPPSGRVPLSYWWLDSGGPWRRERMIDVPDWSTIAGNYAGAARAALDGLMAATSPPEHGRLLLWHGPPGTGKTYALRALVDAWRGWCAAHFVTDPEELFGQGAAYLARILVTPDAFGRAWNLLVLEDTGELMAADARRRSGQGLSRLLNLADGLLGQGTRTLVLLTTNEPLRRLDAAVHRAGRCWAEVEFPPLSPAEAAAWLADHGREGEPRAPATIAELFAGSGRRTTERPSFGFAT